MPNVFIGDLENIGKHIRTGLLSAAPLVEKIITAPQVAAVPVLGPILSELGAIFSSIEADRNSKLTTADVEEIVTAVVTAMQVKSAVAANAAATPAQ